MLQNIIFYISFGITLIIIVAHIFLLVGIILNRIRDKYFTKLEKDGATNINLTVIIAAKDEEKNLPELLFSLENQSINDFEIVIVNDRSTDRTGEILENFRKKHSDRVTIIENKEKSEQCNPKQFALDLGIEKAKGDVFLFTDADCIVPPEWVEYCISYFSRFRKSKDVFNRRIGLLFGQVLVRHDRSFFQGFQAFDQLLIHQYNSGSAGMGFLTGCFGNNLAVEREVLDRIGGFRALGFTLTEDAALLGQVAKFKEWTGKVTSLEEMSVHPAPQKSWKDFLNQHIRWNAGGFYAEDPAAKWSYRLIVLYLVFSIIILPVAVFYPFLFMFPVTSFVFPGLLAFTAGLFYYKNRVNFLLWFIPRMLFFMFFYSIVTVLAMFKVRIKWKDSELKI